MSEIPAQFKRALKFLDSGCYSNALAELVALHEDFPGRDSLVNNILFCLINDPQRKSFDWLAFVTKALGRNSVVSNDSINQMLVYEFLWVRSWVSSSLLIDKCGRSDLISALRSVAESDNFFDFGLIEAPPVSSKPLVEKYYLVASFFASKEAYRLAGSIYRALVSSWGIERLDYIFDYAVLLGKQAKHARVIEILAPYSRDQLPDPILATWANAMLLSGNAKSALDELKSIGFDSYLDADRALYQTALVYPLLLLEVGEASDAEERLLSLRENYDNDDRVWSSLAAIYVSTDLTSAAVECAEKALTLNPDNNAAKINLATALTSLREFERAEALYKDVVSGEGSRVTGSSYLNLAIAQLKMGKFDQAWKFFEYRRKEGAERGSSWLKANVAGLPRATEVTSKLLSEQHVLVVSEQGLGDVVLATRFVACLQSLSVFKAVSLCCDLRLIQILKKAYPDVGFIGLNGEEVDDDARFDCFEYLYSLPWLLRGKFFNQGWSDARNIEFSHQTRLRYQPQVAGICWSSANKKIGTFKGVPLNDLLAGMSNRHKSLQGFLNCQYGSDASSQLSTALSDHPELSKIQLDPGIDVANDFQGLIDYCIAQKVVIFGASNSLIHIAGLVGVPTIVVPPANSRAALWYWLQTNSEGYSQWYPSVYVSSDLDDAYRALDRLMGVN